MRTSMRLELVANTTALLLIPAVARAQPVVRVIGGGEPPQDYTELHTAEAAARNAFHVYVTAEGDLSEAMYKVAGAYSSIIPPGCTTSGLREFTPSEKARCDALRLKIEVAAKAKCMRSAACKAASDNEALARVAREKADAAYEALACSLEGAEPRAACGHILGTVCLAGVPCHRATAAEVAQRDHLAGAFALYWPGPHTRVNEVSHCRFWVEDYPSAKAACTTFCGEQSGQRVVCACNSISEPKEVPVMCSRSIIDPRE